MEIVVLSHDDVAALLPMSDCIELMSEALSALARGEVDVALAVVAPEADDLAIHGAQVLDSRKA